MSRILELRQNRAKLIKDARELNDNVAEDRDMTQEEQNTWDTLMNKADELRTRIEREERLATQETDLEEPVSEPVATREEPGSAEPRVSKAERHLAAFRTYLPHWVTGDYRGLPPAEFRALQQDLDTAGGYLVPPEQFVNDLIKAVDDMVVIRGLASTFTVSNADSLGVPSLDTDPADADWTSELATGNEDTAMALGKRELHPHPLAKLLKISRKLIRSVPSSETLVRDRLAYKFGITQEKAFLTGTGANQPLGVFTASADGISTSRDEATDNTTTAVTFDGLINAKFMLKSQYYPRARWIFHRDTVKMIAKLKDGNGQYLWRESVRVGEPDRVLGIPVAQSEYAPNTFTTGLYVGIIGDFSNYWIADALTFELQRLEELYAATNQVGLIGRLETDGMPVLEEAFVRVTLA